MTTSPRWLMRTSGTAIRTIAGADPALVGIDVAAHSTSVPTAQHNTTTPRM